MTSVYCSKDKNIHSARATQSRKGNAEKTSALPLRLCVFVCVFCKALCAQPLTLYQAIQKTLQHNETVLYNTQQNYLSAQSQLHAAESFYRPQLDLSLNTYRSQGRIFSGHSYFSSHTHTATSNIDLNYSFLTPFGGRTRIGIGYQTIMAESNAFYSSPQLQISYQQPLSRPGMQAGHADIIRARNDFASTKMSYQLQKDGLILFVVDFYFQLWQSFQEVKQNERELESALRVLEIAEMRLNAGEISEFEAMNTRVQHRLTEDNLKVAQNNLRTQKRVFLRLLGNKDLDQAVQLAEDIKTDTIEFDLEFALQQAFQNRLEIQQNEIRLGLAKLRLQEAAAAFYPTLFINGSYALSSQFNVPFETAFGELPNRSWTVQAGFSFPILDGGLRAEQIQIARYSYNVQRKDLELLRQDISLEVEEQFRSLQLNRDRIQSLSLNLTMAQEALKIAELRFKLGQISSTEIENIRQRYNRAQNSLNNARIAFITQSARLAKAMGRIDKWVDALEENER